MEAGFLKATSSNLPKVDVIMLGAFFANNTNFCSAEFRNTKTSLSSRASYGDDAISYVQLKRDGKLCTIKCKICPEHKVRSKLYTVTLVIDEEEDLICSLECHDCVASHGGCKHAIAFVMWIHRRSEEPSCTSTECYWKKSKLSQVGTSLKCITAKEMSKGCPSLSSNSSVLAKYLHEASKRKIEDCELLKYQPNSNLSDTALVSMHQLVFKFKEKCSEIFIQNVNIPDITIRKVEKETRNQYKSRLWYELRYGRITASRAFEVSRCKTPDGTLISTIMGGQIPDTPAMRRGRILEDSVRQILQRKLKKTIRTCGLILNSKYPMIAGSPDGICEEYIIEIKCPTSAKTFMNYIKDGKTTERYYYQIQIQMYLADLKKCIFCVADPKFSENKKIEMLYVDYDEKIVVNIIETNLVPFWQNNVYPLLYQSINNS
ncbi:uncharacterized protein LOC124633669 [Helicoverpa zea]|uniref:uncharacterized protein LOC124633669 n=1 Tax=Helicoverpa zea TaxID=7113 RepID=UPI001F56DA58|nr:uncharacterized protein LOC124633669 [Helicoverpa zea]